ncbi:MULTISPECIES: hypothetical protein [Streptomyces]|nr:hypothetical protein [Streptomyces sp. NEAU-HV9]
MTVFIVKCDVTFLMRGVVMTRWLLFAGLLLGRHALMSRKAAHA